MSGGTCLPHFRVYIHPKIPTLSVDLAAADDVDAFEGAKDALGMTEPEVDYWHAEVIELDASDFEEAA